MPGAHRVHKRVHRLTKRKPVGIDDEVGTAVKRLASSKQRGDTLAEGLYIQRYAVLVLQHRPSDASAPQPLH